MQVLAIVDPITESGQRMSPLLRIFRDRFRLPLTVIVAPATMIDNDQKLPITSYYRFVAGDSDGARFSNLPIDHILTLRTVSGNNHGNYSWQFVILTPPNCTLPMKGCT